MADNLTRCGEFRKRSEGGGSLWVDHAELQVRGMALVVEPAAEEDDGVASPHGPLTEP